MKLFQIEEPEGGPTDPNAPGAAIGIDASGKLADVAFSVGGNPTLLPDREGFESNLVVPAGGAEAAQWQELFEAVRLRAERALARPVTHAVIALAPEACGSPAAAMIATAAETAGLLVLRLIAATELAPGMGQALSAAMLAEDLASRFDSRTP
jgi:hypothetical protein